MSTQSKSLRIADYVAKNRYAWPGGYRLYAIAHDSEAICCDCCSNERYNIATTDGKDGWCLIDADVNYENDNLYCAHCGSKIGPEYN